MVDFTSFSALRSACLDLPNGNPAASAAVARREATLTKPPGSLGRLEELVGWLAHWQSGSRFWCSPAIMALPSAACRPIRLK
jgi:hypothetical protein